MVGAGLGVVTLKTCEPAEMMFYENVAMPAIRLLDPEVCVWCMAVCVCVPPVCLVCCWV